MNTDDETRLTARLRQMPENELVQTLFLLEHTEQIDVTLRDVMAGVWPTLTMPEPDTQVTDITAMVRAELKSRIIAKGGRQP
jgi:hypothetical protein